MTDLLIRHLDESDVQAIDELAARLGISRNELLRRETTNLARRARPQGSKEDFVRASELLSDALDPQIMSRAW
ncbi:MAG: type II toxin-antitoxin system VapB family antitoxin [Ancrocorticia sp.]|uniref:type II toxin-antitoxin system VapB family antitoxin n=1 Tax=Ancrocorticia sp. TaxID=2593684 RepID=UPI003F92CE78